MRADIDKVARAILALLLFGLSLTFLIPPIPSDPSSKYTFFPGGAIGVLLFGLCRAIDTSQGKWRILVVILETVFFLIYGILLYERIHY